MAKSLSTRRSSGFSIRPIVTRSVNLADIIEVVADAVPDRPALITDEIERTYGELDERATRLANHLAANGVGKDDHVAIHAMNSAEWVEGFYACFKLRAVPINVNYRYVEAELRYLYDNADCVAVIVQPQFLPAVEAIRDTLPRLGHVLVIGDDYERAVATAPAERNFQERSPDDLYIVYTGGTTGMPKGVMWRQEDIFMSSMNVLRSGKPIDRLEELGEEARGADPVRVIGLGPLMHGGSQWTMGNVHSAGGVLVLYTRPRFDAHAVLDLIARTKVQVLAVLGDAMARPLAEALLDPDRPGWDLSNLFAVNNGAAPLSNAVREQLHAALPQAMIVDNYGASETGVTGSRPDSGEGFSAPRFHTDPDTAVISEDLRVCGPGAVGLLARSGHIPLGYYKDAEKAAKTFPIVEGRRWVIPGDFARIEDDGTISVLGRGSTSINSGGEKIFPEEVEAALVKHPAVFDAAVVGTPSERWGEQVTALVRLRDGAEASVEDLRGHCRTLIADYKMPKSVFPVESIPRTPAGKVDYPQVKTIAQGFIGDVPKR